LGLPMLTRDWVALGSDGQWRQDGQDHNAILVVILLVTLIGSGKSRSGNRCPCGRSRYLPLWEVVEGFGSSAVVRRKSVRFVAILLYRKYDLRNCDGKPNTDHRRLVFPRVQYSLRNSRFRKNFIFFTSL
jgi:hypothetical protein